MKNQLIKNQLLVAEFLATPWALMPERLSALATVISRWSQGAPASDVAKFQVQTDRVLRDTRRQTSAAISGVAKGRGVPITQVRDGMGQGRVLGADAALAQNMVDGIASFDQVLSKMQKDAASSAKSSPTVKPKTSRLAQARSELGIL